MTTAKTIFIVIVSLVIGAILGYIINSQTVAKYNAINATCTTLNVAVDNNMLTPQQVRELGQLTKQKLADSGTAKNFQINQEQIQAASSDSNCSQYMVGMSE